MSGLKETDFETIASFVVIPFSCQKAFMISPAPLLIAHGPLRHQHKYIKINGKSNYLKDEQFIPETIFLCNKKCFNGIKNKIFFSHVFIPIRLYYFKPIFHA